MAKEGKIFSKNNMMKMAMGIVIVGGTILSAQALGILPDKPLSAQVGSGASTAQAVQSGQFCSTDNGVKISGKINMDNVDGTVDQVATTMAAYRDGATSSSASVTSSTANETEIIDNINCGEQLDVYFGDGSTYYYQKRHISSDETLQRFLTVSGDVKKAEAATITFANDSGTFGTDARTTISTAGGNAKDIEMKVKAGSYYFGDGGFALCARYDTANISKVEIQGSATKMAGALTVVPATTGKTSVCYEYSVDLHNGESVVFPVSITAKSGVDSNEAVIDVYVYDKAGYFLDGELLSGYVDNAGDDIGLSVVSKTSAITVG